MLATYAYDDEGRRTSLTFGNGVVQAYGYDAVSRLASLTNDLSGTTNDLTHTFAYDPASEIATLTRSNDLYAYPKAAVSETGTANGLNQLTTYAGKSLGYDARGNVAAFGSDSYVYSSENLLTSATVGSTSTTFAYDPMTRLYQSVSGAATSRLAYDGVDRIAEYSARTSSVAPFSSPWTNAAKAARMLEGWRDYYLLVGSAAAALIGLLFVVATLTAGRERSSVEVGTRFYMTPIVFDLAAVLVMSGAAMTPVISGACFGWLTLAFAAVAAAGDARIAYGIRHLPAGVAGGWFDVWWYGIIPFALSLLLAASGAAMLLHQGWAASAIAALLMALLLTCIHNAWDLVTYLAPQEKPNAEADERGPR